MITEPFTVHTEGLTVSKIIWLKLKRKPKGLTAKILEINPGLASLGPTLPVGTVFDFPLDYEDPSPQETTVRLWD